VTKLEAFQCYFVTKLYPLKSSPFLKSENDGKQDQPALKQIGLNGDLPQGEQQAQGEAACPEGNSVPLGGAAWPGGAAKLGGSSIPRGSDIKGLSI
jgi:hypothetical protein